MRFFILSLAFLLAACGMGDVSVQEGSDASAELNVTVLTDQVIEDGQELLTLLASVRDVESAEAIEPQLTALIAEYEAMESQLEAMEAPTMAEMRALLSKAPQIAQTQQDIATEVQRIYANYPDAAEVLREAIGRYGQ